MSALDITYTGQCCNEGPLLLLSPQHPNWLCRSTPTAWGRLVGTKL